MVSALRRLFGGGSKTTLDPACGMEVDTRTPPGGTSHYEGTTYYFCSRGCRLEFEDDPQSYLSGEKQQEM